MNIAGMTSPRLCGGMLVAIPTAIPSAPLIRMFGTFTGSTEDNIIRGEFSGSGSVTFTGTWQADGKSNEFRITGIKNQPSYGDSKDTLAKHIVEGLENATSYEGDERNLYLYFEYEKETLCIAFTPER